MCFWPDLLLPPLLLQNPAVWTLSSVLMPSTGPMIYYIFTYSPVLCRNCKTALEISLWLSQCPNKEKTEKAWPPSPKTNSLPNSACFSVLYILHSRKTCFTVSQLPHSHKPETCFPTINKKWFSPQWPSLNLRSLTESLRDWKVQVHLFFYLRL